MIWTTVLLLTPAALIVLAILEFIVDYKTSEGDSKLLRNGIKRRFYPLLNQLGFKKGKTNSIEVTFRRFFEDRVHIVQLCWDKYHNPSFSVLFGECPNAVISLPIGDFQPEFLEPYHSKALGFLLRSHRQSISNCGFRLQKPYIEMITSRRIRYETNEVVDQLIKYYPQVEHWFETKEVGPNINVTWR
jgi:hypothetical protein